MNPIAIELPIPQAKTEQNANPNSNPNVDLDRIDELPVAYVEMDAHGAITRANRITRLLHSKDTGELIGKLAWELMPTDEQEQSCAVFMTAMESGQDPPSARRSIYTRSGQFRVHEIHRNLIRNAQGVPIGMRVVSIDVTDAHQALEEARHQRAWLESVLASMSHAVLVTDTLGFIRYVNPAAETLFGWRAIELIGKETDNVLPVLSYISGNKTVLDYNMELENQSQGIATILDRDSREVRVEIATAPMLDKESGFTSGVVTVFRRLRDAG